jgi:hypothetical protein
MRFDVLTAVGMESTIRWDVTLPMLRCFLTSLIVLHFDVEDGGTISSSEMLTNVYQTTRCHIPEHSRYSVNQEMYARVAAIPVL